MSVPENEVLKPRSRALVDEDLWAEINLTNADVRDPTTGEPANLLHADPLQPVRVTGKLELEKDQAHLLKRPLPSRTTLLELSNVTKYAYGQCEDGEIVFWAAGVAGWFKIRPSRAYKEMYQGMIEAIEILYFVADVYKGWSKVSAPARTAERIFKAFAKKHPQRYADKEAAVKAVHAHREFLLLIMLKGNEEVDWAHTAFFLYLKNSFPDDYEAMLRKMKGKPARGPKAKSRVTGSRSMERQPQGQSTEEDELKRKPGRTAAATSSTASNGLPKKDNNWWESKVIWEMMQISEVQGLLQSGEITVEACAKIMVRKYEVDDENLARDYIRAHASNLVYMMTHKRKPANEFWTSQPVFAELSSTQLSSSALKRVSELQVRRRKVPLPDPSPPPQQFEDSSSEEDIHTIRRRANKGKSSVLRPRSNKFSGKGTTRSGKSYLRSSGEEDSDSDNPGVTSPSKRKTSPGEATAGRGKRTARGSQMRPSGGATISPPDSSDDDEKPPPLPLHFKEERSNASETPASKYTPRIVSESVASFEANSPGDVWRCSFDGCAHKVYGASTAEAQLLIQEHCDEHDEKRKAQIDLVRMEEGRSNLPVSNLIKRIREMAEQQQSMMQMGIGGQVSKPAFPQPVQRRY